MSSVEICVDFARDLTRVRMVGILSPDHFIEAMTNADFGQTDLVLWDLRDASFSDMTREKLHVIANNVLELEMQTGWRAKATAVVANNPFGLVMIQLYFEIARYEIKRDIAGLGTTSIHEAEGWLNDALPLPQRSVG